MPNKDYNDVKRLCRNCSKPIMASRKSGRFVSCALGCKRPERPYTLWSGGYPIQDIMISHGNIEISPGHFIPKTILRDYKTAWNPDGVEYPCR